MDFPHGKLSDIINSLIKGGLKIEFIHKFDKIFYKALPGIERDKNSWWYLLNYRNKVPLMFTLKAFLPHLYIYLFYDKLERGRSNEKRTRRRI